MSQQGLNFSKKSVKEKKIDLTFTDVHLGIQKVPKSDFQSQFSMSTFFESYKKIFHLRISI